MISMQSKLLPIISLQNGILIDEILVKHNTNTDLSSGVGKRTCQPRRKERFSTSAKEERNWENPHW
jgi:hypothetical protein